MSRYTFSDAERYAVYTVHGERCYMCHNVIDLLTMEVDHIIPEHLLDKPEELAGILHRFGLPHDFSLNSYANWMPACGPCNNRKRGKAFQPTPLIQMELQIAREKASKAMELAATVVSKQRVTKAINAIKRAFACNEQIDEIVAELRPLVLFHLEHRDQDMVAEPIHLAPNYNIFLEIEFIGGCFDKKILRGGTPEFDADKSKWLLMLVGAYIANAKKENKHPASYFRWRQPVPEMVALAKEQGWSLEVREKRMRYHVYHATGWEASANIVRFKAEYQGIE